jgi:hypothetical protein
MAASIHNHIQGSPATAPAALRFRLRKHIVFCEECTCDRVFHRRRFRHRWHLLLTALTAGLWLALWIGLLLRHRLKHPWRCAWCGVAKPKCAPVQPSLQASWMPAPGGR